MRTKTMMFAALAAILAIPAPAAYAQTGYVTAKYTGTVTQVYDGSTYFLGEPIYTTVTFDPSKLTDHTASVNAVLSGPIGSDLQFDSVFTASLADDPLASLTIRIGKDVFTKFDEDNYGSPNGDAPFNLGAGDFPNVFQLNGAFSGAGGNFTNAKGDFLANDPIASTLGYYDGHGFYIGDATSDAEGNFDFAHAVFSPAVPEPATWMMLIGGLGIVGGALRRRRALAGRRFCAA